MRKCKKKKLDEKMARPCGPQKCISPLGPSIELHNIYLYISENIPLPGGGNYGRGKKLKGKKKEGHKREKGKGKKKGGKKGTKGMVEKKGKGKMGGNGKLEASEVTSTSMSKSQLKSN